MHLGGFPPGPFRVDRGEPGGEFGLQRDHREAVPQDVVHVAGEAQPLLGGGQPRLGGLALPGLHEQVPEPDLEPVDGGHCRADPTGHGEVARNGTAGPPGHRDRHRQDADRDRQPGPPPHQQRRHADQRRTEPGPGRPPAGRHRTHQRNGQHRHPDQAQLGPTPPARARATASRPRTARRSGRSRRRGCPTAPSVTRPGSGSRVRPTAGSRTLAHTPVASDTSVARRARRSRRSARVVTASLATHRS